MPNPARCSCGPMPESIRSCGELTAPPHKITSRAARAVSEPAMPAKCYAGGTAAFEQNLLGQGPGNDIKIGALHCRAKIADRGRAALTVACRRLVVADPVLACSVEIVIPGNAEPSPRPDKSLTDRVLRHIRHSEPSVR